MSHLHSVRVLGKGQGFRGCTREKEISRLLRADCGKNVRQSWCEHGAFVSVARLTQSAIRCLDSDPIRVELKIFQARRMSERRTISGDFAQFPPRGLLPHSFCTGTSIHTPLSRQMW